MRILKNNEKGFGTVEAILIVIILVLIGAVGYLVYKNHHKTPPKVVTITKTVTNTPKTNSTTATNPYTGWKSYTLPVEKLSFMYPSSWLATNSPPSSTQDSVIMASGDGFNFIIEDGTANGGDPRPQDTSMPLPVRFLGQSDYFVFGYARMPNSLAFSNTQIDSGGLQITPSDETSLPVDKTAVGPNDTTGAIDAKYFRILGNFGTSPPSMTINQAQNNQDFKDAILVIQSMHY